MSSRGGMPAVAGATDSMDTRGRVRSLRIAAHAAIEHGTATGTYLRTRSITDATQPAYHNALQSFANFSARGGHTRSTPAAVDTVLELCFDELFFDGENPHIGKATIAALSDYMRWSTKGRFPRARCALRDWRVVVPDRARSLIPWESVLLLVKALLDDPDDMPPLAACALMILFDCYVWPGGCLRISKASVFPPRKDSRLYTNWATTAGRPIRTSIHYDTVTVDFINPAQAWIVDIVSLLYRFNSDDASLFGNRALHDLERCMKTATWFAGLMAGHPVPHTCRHKGPSTDMLANVTDPASIQTRNRWDCIDCVRQYEKHAKLLRTAIQITRQQLNRAALPSDRQSILRCLQVRMAGILKSKGKNKLVILHKQSKITG